jgi:pyruvate/2-oxoglutarate dehydrogenase complex dihydrolipoamide acyltransferase (E2) component
MKEIASAKGIRLTYMPFFIKAASKALEKFPILNVKVDDSCEKLTYRKSHNIGVAMETSDGLVVPNIKNVQELSLLEVAKELSRLHELGKNGALRREDLIDGTFSMSNIGAVSVLNCMSISCSIQCDPKVVVGFRAPTLWIFISGGMCSKSCTVFVKHPTPETANQGSCCICHC